MIYCPNCGTANRDGSRFCNDCGADLGAALGRRCPMCSTMNPEESTVCGECGARLVPQTAPLTEAGQEAETSDWLQQLRAGSAEETPPSERPAMPGIGPAEPAEEIPDWLRRLQPPEPVEEEIPDWLKGIQPPEEKPRVPPMAWEDEAEARREPPSVEVVPYPPGEEEPDWLKRLRAVPTGKPVPAEEPAAPPRPIRVPPTREVPAPPREEALGADWLERLRQTMPEETPSAEVAEAAPPVFEEVEAPPFQVEAEPAEEIPDWLQRLRPEPEVPPTPVEAEVPPWAEEVEPTEEIPDWLQSLRPQPEAPPTPVEAETLRLAEEEEEIPDWLQELRPKPEAPPMPTEAPPSAEEEEAEEGVPDWLQRLRLEPEGPPSVTVEEAPLPAVEEEEEVPDWLRELRPEPEAPPTPAEAKVPPLAEEEVPDWLQRLRLEPEGPPSVTVEEAPPPTVGEEAEEIPDWLQELRAEPEVPPTPAEAKIPSLAVEAEPEEEIPEWLEGLGPPEEVEKPIVALEELEEGIEEEMPPPLEQVPDRLKELGLAPEGEVPVFEEAEEVLPSEEMPEWLRELGPPRLAAEEAAEAPPAILGEVPTSEIPDWLKELGPPVPAEKPAVEVEEKAPLPPPAPMKEKVSPPVVAEEAVEGLAQAEIPAWLRGRRPLEAEEGIVEVPGVVEAIETRGLLAGIPGVLSVEPIVSRPHKAPPAPTKAATVGSEQADLFREIIAQEPVPVPEAVSPRRARIWGGVWRRVIYLLMALAVIIPLFGRGDWFGEAELPSGAAADFYNTIQNLPSDSVVLLAFDYDPSTAAEMDRLAEPVLWHLMDRQVRLMAVSLFPAGPAAAGNLLDRVAGEHGGGYQYGQDYVNLGYIPGQAAAPNELASDLRALVPQDYRQGKSLGELPATQEVHGIQDVRLIIEFAAQQRTLQWWIEQVGSQYQVEIMAAVSASVEPTATPYHHSGQLVGLISGLPSAVQYAAQYEVQTGKRPSLAIASVDAQSVAHLAVVALIVLGTLASLVSARRKG